MQLSEVLKNTNRIQGTMHGVDKNEGIIASDYAAAKDNTAIKITIHEQRFARMEGYFEILADENGAESYACRCSLAISSSFLCTMLIRGVLIKILVQSCTVWEVIFKRLPILF